MKRLVLCALCLFAGSTLQALPVGNPGEASLYKNGLYCESNQVGFCEPGFSWCAAWSLRLGFYGDYVFNRNLRVDAKHTEFNNKPILRTQIFTNAAYLAVNFANRIDLFSSLGGTKIRQRFDNGITMGVGCAEMEYETAFSFSVGGRATLWECNCLLVGLEGQYFRTQAHIRSYCESDMLFFTPKDFSNTYSDWQIGLGASYAIETNCPRVSMLPYIAVTWSQANITGDRFIEFLDSNDIPAFILVPTMKNAKVWGFAVGTTFNLCEIVGVTVEGHYGSEVALYVNGQVRF